MTMKLITHRAIFLTAIGLSVATFSIGQELPIDSITDKVTMSEIFEVNGNKNQLYLKAKQWISDEWKTSNAVIDVEDKEEGIIILKPIFTYKEREDGITIEMFYSFNFKIYLKDNKAKVIFTNIKRKLTFPNDPSFNDNSYSDIETYLRYDNKAKGAKEAKQKAITEIIYQSESIIKSFKAALMKKLDNDF